MPNVRARRPPVNGAEGMKKRLRDRCGVGWPRKSCMACRFSRRRTPFTHPPASSRTRDPGGLRKRNGRRRAASGQVLAVTEPGGAVVAVEEAQAALVRPALSPTPLVVEKVHGSATGGDLPFMAGAAAGSGTAGGTQEPVSVSRVVQGIFVPSAECGALVLVARRCSLTSALAPYEPVLPSNKSRRRRPKGSSMMSADTPFRRHRYLVPPPPESTGFLRDATISREHDRHL